MNTCVEDNSAAIAALRRLEDEVAELRVAVEGGSKAGIVDELVDVTYYVNRVMFACGLTSSMVKEYGKVKSALRDCGVRNKIVELRLAAEFVSDLTP